MAFYAGGAMPGEVQATHLLAVVEVVQASRVSVGIPFRGGQARRGCIGKDAEILSTRDGKSWASFLLAETNEQGAGGLSGGSEA